VFSVMVLGAALGLYRFRPPQPAHTDNIRSGGSK
jgi:hypothetical protein